MKKFFHILFCGAFLLPAALWAEDGPWDDIPSLGGPYSLEEKKDIRVFVETVLDPLAKAQAAQLRAEDDEYDQIYREVTSLEEKLEHPPGFKPDAGGNGVSSAPREAAAAPGGKERHATGTSTSDSWAQRPARSSAHRYHMRDIIPRMTDYHSIRNGYIRKAFEQQAHLSLFYAPARTPFHLFSAIFSHSLSVRSSSSAAPPRCDLGALDVSHPSGDRACS